MITAWFLVYFLHDLKGEGIEDQMTLGKYNSLMACETIRSHATSDKSNLVCIGVTTDTKYPITNFKQKRWF